MFHVTDMLTTMRSTKKTKRLVTFVMTSWLLTATTVYSQTAKYDDRYTLQGFSQPTRVAKVATAIAGIVESIETKEGQRVDAGECLVKLDSAVHQQKLELARVAKESLGELASAKAELNAKTTRLERISALASRRHATEVELIQAQEDVAIAQAGLIRAKDRLAQLSADYNRLNAESKQYQITAPFPGIVVEFAKEVGEYVGPGDPIVCTIVDLDTLSVEFLVPRNYRHNLNTGDAVDILFTVAGEVVTGTVDYISPFPNGETNTFTVKTSVDNANHHLSAGERCQIQGLNHVMPASVSEDNPRLSMRDK